MTARSGEIVLALEPTTIAEWDVRDIVYGEQAAGLALATRDQAERLLDEVELGVPRLSPVRTLAQGAGDAAGAGPAQAAGGFGAAGEGGGSGGAGSGVPLSRPPAADASRFDFHLMELPVHISVPAGRTLSRLRLGLRAEPARHGAATHGAATHGAATHGAATHEAAPVVAYDLFPELEATSQRLANPVAWDISGDAIGEAFTVYVIWRAPRSVPLWVSASMLGELLGTGDPTGSDAGAESRRPASGLRKAQFRSASQLYEVPAGERRAER